MAIKRTFGFDEYQKKISEGIEEIGFKRYVQEHEEENTATSSVDDLGQGEPITDAEIDTPTQDEEIPATPEAPAEEKNETETIAQPIDTGDREDISVEEAQLKLNYVRDTVKNLQNLVANNDKVKLDKQTRERIIKFYNFIQGIA